MVPAILALTTAAAVLTGCSGDDKGKEAKPTSTVIYPGKPGEPNQTRLASPVPAAKPNAADVTFMQMMIPHHQQALEMSVLAPKQASDPQVKALAARIDASQTAEISGMQSWLRKYVKRPAAGHHGHGTAGAPSHATMPGMATAEQLAQLRAAQGAEFDRLYLNLMIAHHEGALTMARDALAKGTDTVVLEMAKDTLTGQQAEILRMHDLQKT